MKQVQAGTDISVDEIRISPYHFRKETVREKLEGLARSMRELGQIHNVSVVKGPRGGFELANGHRRLLAEKEINGARTIRADVYEFTQEELEDEQAQQKAISQFLLAANQSEPLVPRERAQFYRDVMEKFGWDMDRISEFYGVAKADIIHDLRYLQITPKVFDIIAEHPERVSKEHLDLLAEWSSPDKKGWRLTETAQLALVDTLIKQTDKPAAEDPKEFVRTIKSIKADERRQKSKDNKAKRERHPVQILKEVIRALESADVNITALMKLDIPKDTVIELVDKREIIDRCYALAQALIDFGDTTIAALPVKRTPQVTNA